MKKLVTLLLLTGLCAAALPMSVSAAETANLAAADGVEIICDYSHEDDGWNWHASNLNDGDPIEAVNMNGQGYGAGYHSAYGASEAYGGSHGENYQYVGYNFGAKKTFNTVVITPVAKNTFPVDFEIQVSDNGESWKSVVTKTGYAISEEEYTFCPQTFTFDSQSAQYVRLYVTKLNNDGVNYALKLTEFEVFNVTETTTAPENLAKNKPVTSDSYHVDGPWNLAYINDGDRANLNTSQFDYGQFAGYHSSPSTPRDGSDAAQAQFTIDLGEGTKFDTVVIYPSHEKYSFKAPVDGDGVYFPANFKIQYSADGESWTDALTKTDYVCSGVGAQTFTFDEVTARYIRFQMVNMTGYAKLTEFEVYSTAKEEQPPVVNPPVDPGTETPTAPSTGDFTMVAIAAVTLLSLTVVGLTARKRKSVK